MEVKIQCGCGTRYKFDIEPTRGRLPGPVKCPACGTDGTSAANEFIGQHPPAAASSASTGLRLSSSAEPAETRAAASQGSSPLSALPRQSSFLNRTSYFVKERIAVLKLTDTYDILDPATGQQIGTVKEEPPAWAKWLRLLVNKQLMPTRVNVYEHDGGPPVVSVYRGFGLIRHKVHVVAENGQSLGCFKSKIFSLGGGFHVFDNSGEKIAEVKGDWKGWNFKFLTPTGHELGTVTKKWAGLGKELFTSADNYIIALNDLTGVSPVAGALLLAAGLAIDIVFKERK